MYGIVTVCPCGRAFRQEVGAPEEYYFKITCGGMCPDCGTPRNKMEKWKAKIIKTSKWYDPRAWVMGPKYRYHKISKLEG